MMDYVVVGIIAIVSILLFAVGRRGRKELSKQEDVVREIEQKISSQYPDVQIIGTVSCQGGYPPLPYISVLNFAMAGKVAFLYDGFGRYGELDCRDWIEVDKFSKKMKTQPSGAHVLLGPLAPIVIRDKMRHFIAIKYIDINREENHLLFEVDESEAQEEIYNEIVRRITNPMVEDTRLHA
ncbi:MAG: hypothetical protein H6Q72_3096 [Firmicutes bacterium]|nr:hypothetical protein [Bacillota bacterium]